MTTTWSEEMKEPSCVSLELSKLESRGSTLSSSPAPLQGSALLFCSEQNAMLQYSIV